MDNYMMLDGKKYELSPELVNALRSRVEPEPEKKSPFARVGRLDEYWAINARGAVDCTLEDNSIYDAALFAVANYCTDKSLMDQRAMHETLNRLLWRYSEEHGGDTRWGPGNDAINEAENGEHAYLYLDGDETAPRVGRGYRQKILGTVYFRNESIAEAAINEIVKPFLAAHPDFVW